ncbi:uncharacterized protein FOMMEDRAFT_150732 [Fomitiporia mediterranea MF3/22]|uniref:uncharacterized protein n=1 Tax=Fomitiporia mediterranea (strain MF3/22) TaxID=694068 RepID=UPI0004407647|nr:uncharacterized protein FOMMEDRAFT_150732 [Fomitiporia mediterranea MF3/22]EJD08060.1 hypothetical protein FOMMEDRAFT_150732 [Fomitiporia mediterranea MF3/22]
MFTSYNRTCTSSFRTYVLENVVDLSCFCQVICSEIPPAHPSKAHPVHLIISVKSHLVASVLLSLGLCFRYVTSSSTIGLYSIPRTTDGAYLGLQYWRPELFAASKTWLCRRGTGLQRSNFRVIALGIIKVTEAHSNLTEIVGIGDEISAGNKHRVNMNLGISIASQGKNETDQYIARP